MGIRRVVVPAPSIHDSILVEPICNLADRLHQTKLLEDSLGVREQNDTGSLLRDDSRSLLKEDKIDPGGCEYMCSDKSNRTAADEYDTKIRGGHFRNRKELQVYGSFLAELPL